MRSLCSNMQSSPTVVLFPHLLPAVFLSLPSPSSSHRWIADVVMYMWLSVTSIWYCFQVNAIFIDGNKGESELR